MKLNHWFSHSTYLSHVRMGVAGALVVAAVGIAFVAAKTSTPSPAPARGFVLKKGDPDAIEPGSNKRAVFSNGSNEYRGSDYTPDVEAYLIRAYPADEVSGDSTIAAQNGWSKLNSSSHSPGSWTLIGPSTASFPDVLTFSGAPYITSGRITALGIGSTCTTSNCTVYVGAAGGGIWRTNNALAATPTWTFLSGSFGTNAIGSILVDPTNSNIIYAGTGEPNASGDSEAGVGIYKSTDGGNTWALVPDSGKFFQRGIGQMDFDKDHKLLVPIGSAVRGVSSVTSGASSSGATGHPLPTRGLYRCDGVTCTLIRPIVAVATARGSTTVKADPTHPGVIYVNEFSRGIWRSIDNGSTWTQMKAPLNAARSTDRAEFAVTTLPNGKTRMYVGVGNDLITPASQRARVYRTDDAQTATDGTFIDLTTDRNIGYCDNGVNGAQCWYDNFVVSPAGNPDMVYLGGAYSYNSYGRATNGRGVLQSIDAGAHWGDQTWDATTTPKPPANCCNPSQFAPNGIHPDQHALVVSPSNPGLFFDGSDGGLMRSSGSFADISSQCDSRGLTPTQKSRCKELLSRVPTQLYSLNKGLSTLQFQSFSVAAPGPQNTFIGSGQNGDDIPQTKIMGGTQDNGTFQFTGSTNLWPQIIYGDGGQSGFSSTNDRLRFNTFTGQANDANFQDGDPLKWVIISAPILSSNEASYFYPPIISDPHPANGQTIFQGSFSVWRTQDWGGNQAYLEANCQEFTESATKPGCGDFVPLGGPATGSGSDPGDLRGTFYGATRTGGAVAWLQRAPQNTGTMWAATGAGRVFISDNVDAAAASVVWTRLDAGASPPNRAISAIAVDPTNANHAWLSYNGYNVTFGTSAPGHVFEAVRTGPTATFTDISYNLPDFPITALVRDDVTGDLYAGSDFGVMRLPNGSTTWVVAGTGLPMVEVAGLTVVPQERKLYAATHGRSGWMLNLP